jgi:hypothetical protein
MVSVNRLRVSESQTCSYLRSQIELRRSNSWHFHVHVVVARAPAAGVFLFVVFIGSALFVLLLVIGATKLWAEGYAPCWWHELIPYRHGKSQRFCLLAGLQLRLLSRFAYFFYLLHESLLAGSRRCGGE